VTGGELIILEAPWLSAHAKILHHVHFFFGGTFMLESFRSKKDPGERIFGS
jgi:hypothetical protein